MWRQCRAFWLHQARAGRRGGLLTTKPQLFWFGWPVTVDAVQMCSPTFFRV